MELKFPVNPQNMNMTVEEFFASSFFKERAKELQRFQPVVMEIDGDNLTIEGYARYEKFDDLTFRFDNHSFRLYVPDLVKMPISKIVSFREVCEVAKTFLQSETTDNQTFYVFLKNFVEENALSGLYRDPPGGPSAGSSSFNVGNSKEQDPDINRDFRQRHGRDLLPQEPSTGFKMPLFRPTEKDDGRVVVFGNPFPKPFVQGGVRIKNVEYGQVAFRSHAGTEIKARISYLSLMTREQAETRMNSRLFDNVAGFGEAFRSLQVAEMYFKQPFPDSVAIKIIETVGRDLSELLIVAPGTIKNPGPDPLLVGRLPNRKGLCVLAVNGSKESMERFAGQIALTQKIQPLSQRIRPGVAAEKQSRGEER